MRERAPSQSRIRFWLSPHITLYVDTHLLEPSGWTWRQFTEAAILAALSPNWPHPTWWHTYSVRGFGNQTLDKSKLVGWTPFLDEIPHAREHITGLDPYAYMAPNRRSLAGYPNRLADTSTAKAEGAVSFKWSTHTHAFLTELGTITPWDDNRTSIVRARRGLKPMTASQVAALCVNAHFERGGVDLGRECMIQVWREYCELRGGYRDHVSTFEGVRERLKRAGVHEAPPGQDAKRVALWTAAQGDHLTLTQQFECGFWPQDFHKRFTKPYETPLCQLRPSERP